jgi:transcription elongation factor Elf1
VPDRQHKPFCEGHIDCPTCGPESCGTVVVVRSDGCPITVLCLTCHQRFDVSEEEEEVAHAQAD